MKKHVSLDIISKVKPFRRFPRNVPQGPYYNKSSMTKDSFVRSGMVLHSPRVTTKKWRMPACFAKWNQLSQSMFLLKERFRICMAPFLIMTCQRKSNVCSTTLPLRSFRVGLAVSRAAFCALLVRSESIDFVEIQIAEAEEPWRSHKRGMFLHFRKKQNDPRCTAN